jgi:hypothetical protein
VSVKLTKQQAAYLRAINDHGRITRGWGGYSSTRVVWRLEELGLIGLRRHPDGRWTAYTLGRNAP